MTTNSAVCDVIEDVYNLMECKRNDALRFRISTMCDRLRPIGRCNNVLAIILSRKAKK